MSATITAPASKSPARTGRLTPAQSKAASHDGPILVLAGAGTGKTKTLVQAYAERVTRHNIASSRILVVTFTNKAAGEMRERLAALLAGTALSSWIGTFHGLGARQLRYEPEVAGLRHGFDILDAEDSKRLIKRVLLSMGIGPRINPDAYSPKALLKIIGHLKDNLVTPEEAAAHMRSPAAGVDPANPVDLDVVAGVYAEYQRCLRDANAADFGDLLLWPTVAMQADEAYRRRWSGMWDALLVDEYQDVNAGQRAWLMLLGEDHRRVFVVGDDDQSVYEFRGADVRIIRGFTDDFPGAAQVKLEENFRSTGHILAVANALIAADTDRIGKTLTTSKGMGDKVDIVAFQGPSEEAAGIAGEMVRRHAAGVAWDDMALLYRGNALSRGFEEALLRAKVPHMILGDTAFYQRAEVKDALALLKLASMPDSPQSDEAFRRMANTPARGLGDVALQAIEAHARDGRLSLLVAAGAAPLPPKQCAAAAAFADMILDVSTDFTLNLADQISVLLDRSGYRAMLRESRADTAEGRLENLQELLSLAGGFHSASDLLEHAVLSGQGAEQDAVGAGCVKLMTLHKAKGGEFDHIFLPAWEAGTFPAAYGSMGEERRLAYVAVTRGKLRVTITYAAFRKGYVKPSRFIEDLPMDHVVHGWLHGEVRPKAGQTQGLSDGPDRSPVFSPVTIPRASSLRAH